MSSGYQCEETWVYVERLDLLAYVGIGAKERRMPQRVVIDLCCQVDLGAQDELSATFDYAPVVKEVKSLCLENDRKLIETLAQEIARACFADARVTKVRVSVAKPRKLPGCDAVGTTRTFRRTA